MSESSGLIANVRAISTMGDALIVQLDLPDGTNFVINGHVPKAWLDLNLKQGDAVVIELTRR